MKNRRDRNFGLQGPALLLSIVLLFVFMPLSAVAQALDELLTEEALVINELETMAMCEECTQTILSNRTVHDHIFREVTQ